MPQKPKPSVKPNDPDEYKRFLETAKEVEASEDARDFDRVFKRVTEPPKAARRGDS